MTRIGRFRDTGPMTECREAARAATALHTLGVIRSDRWPLVAAHLIALGFDGLEVVALACLPNTATRSDVDDISPCAVAELGTRGIEVDEAIGIYANLLAHDYPAGDLGPVRQLASLASPLDYPAGIVSRAYELEEYIDCECHPNGRADALAFMADLRAAPPLEISAALRRALLG